MDVTGESLADQVIHLNDGARHYIRCKFERCTFYLEDFRKLPLFVECELSDCSLAGEEQAFVTFREWTGFALP